MNRQPTYLTKSRFKLALECETKLFYTGKKEYPNTNIGDTFLEALAEGGFQVGELAKMYHPGGVEIAALDKEQALGETEELLQQERCILFEPAFLYDNLFIRVDILIKEGNRIDLIEVKAKSCDFTDSSGFRSAGGYLITDWEPYVYDAAFQKYVLSHACPEYSVNAYLMLADKNAKATVDGLNQFFLIQKGPDGRTGVHVREGITRRDLGAEILRKIQVDDIIDDIFNNTDPEEEEFGHWVSRLADAYEKNRKIAAVPGKKCRDCEFTCSPEDEKSGLRSGFKECWKEAFDLSDKDFSKPTVLTLWDFRKKDKYIEKGTIFLEDLQKEDLPYKESSDGLLSRTERQWLQIDKAVRNDSSAYILEEPLKEEMGTWKFPLHFIDFETSAVAVPFNKGLSPYEGIAFQFSHHVVEGDLQIRHAGEYLHTVRGEFPSFEFLRALRDQLSSDDGSIFRYAPHENTFLNCIYKQLMEADKQAVPDREELCGFIESISHPVKGSPYSWDPGPRDMVDLRRIILDYVYLPRTNGSNSIKDVLPAVLNDSAKLQAKYSKPIYGRGLEIESRNYDSWCWVRYDDNGNVIAPYKLLPPVFDAAVDEIERLVSSPSLSEGGAAMMAYAGMQFSEMAEEERDELAAALLKYCELDTFAMVLLWEYLHDTVLSEYGKRISTNRRA